ncbi:hypothetical protein [Chiayiivirga flava]|uniref:Uncharacterized protein n=1 Tax=Chiayiivirga flava TaxID=659595 RepID=A0A7W8D7P1_9GAMM|nr:hypothetical protein [Chiayiivirga flava]MBB5207783.1 hypothetical protein [Chiayiivirga flava]
MGTGSAQRGGWVAWVAGVCLLALQAGSALAAPVPPVLEPWREWVLHGQAEALCTPFESATRCAWPGELALDVDADGARFTQTWTLQAPQRVPLPGSGEWRPIEVTANGAPVPVLNDGGPWVLLPAGTHRLAGRFAWARRPATLPVPGAIALVSLRVDGVTVAAPERNSEDALVLGAAGAGESDALQIETYRLLADGVPQMLATLVRVSVSGKPREQVLAPLLPAGFVPVLLDGELPARIDGDGSVRVQLRAGQWELLLVARAATPMTEFRLPAIAADGVLPTQEIWQFRDDPLFRLAQFGGVPGIDPTQADTPDWSAPGFEIELLDQHLFDGSDTLPGYVLDADSVATLDVKLRGLPSERPARLSLQRELWLDFDGGGYLAQDTIHGQLGSEQRLDMAAPWSLERATRDGTSPLLVTRGASPELSGVEMRDPAVSLDTGARAPRGGSLPANGWTQPFDSASTVLHLPPGYRLLGATGADRAGGSWWDAWSLLDIFLLSLFALMAFRLGGVALGAGLVAWVLLAWHEPLAPRVSLLCAVALSLLLRHLPPGRLARVTGIVRNVILVLAALLVLPFAAQQLRLSLHPQLERDSTARGYSTPLVADWGGQPQMAMEMAPAAPPPPPAPVMADDGNTLDRVEVTGSRIQRVDTEVSGTRVKTVDLFRYPADTIAQAGSARPGWDWHNHALQWNGPLAVGTELGLVVSPPWLTRTWRVLAVLLLAFIVWRIARPVQPVPSGAASTRRMRRPAAAAGLVLACGLGALPADRAAAQAPMAPIPGPDLLAELRTRLLTPEVACQPHCSALGTVTAIAGDGTLVLQLDAHTQAATAWPLPRPDASVQLVGVRVDGVDAAVARDGSGDWIALDRGVHRVEASYRADGERWRITFPLPPATLDVRADGFEIAGVDEGRLIGDTLDLVPPRRTASDTAVGGEGTNDAATDSVPVFVRVRRAVTIDQQWQTHTTIQRVAPQRSGITLAIALLPGEQIYATFPEGATPPVRNGHAIVSLPAGETQFTWSSRLVPSETLTLTASDGRLYAEEWVLSVAPLLHVDTEGLPQSGEDAPSGSQRFLPLPGETLTARVTRPVAVDGASVAIEDVSLDVEIGQEARSSSLTFTLRATRAGQHMLQLPADAELLGFAIDGAEQPLLLDAGRLTLPLRTAPQRVSIRWRDAVPSSARVSTPDVALGASAANIALHLQLPQDRWLLFTSGPRVGPAVLFWSGLAAMLLVAFVLARIGGTPLRLHDWLLLGLGFSALSWWPAMLVAAWLFVIGWRARHPEWMARRRIAMLLQVALIGATGVALLCLLLAIPYGLLSQPDMHVTGNQSWGNALRWFADRSADGVLPVASAVTLPLWCYKTAILVWSLWLASALLRWLRWTWASLNAGGFWPAKAVPDAAPATPATTASTNTREAPPPDE